MKISLFYCAKRWGLLACIGFSEEETDLEDVFMEITKGLKLYERAFGQSRTGKGNKIAVPEYEEFYRFILLLADHGDFVFGFVYLTSSISGGGFSVRKKASCFSAC